jgi:hypothetical protein
VTETRLPRVFPSALRLGAGLCSRPVMDGGASPAKARPPLYVPSPRWEICCHGSTQAPSSNRTEEPNRKLSAGAASRRTNQSGSSKQRNQPIRRLSRLSESRGTNQSGSRRTDQSGSSLQEQLAEEPINREVLFQDQEKTAVEPSNQEAGGRGTN